MRHTPGPWTVSADPDTCGVYIVREHRAAEEALERKAEYDDANADVIYEQQTKLREANTALIAAAPELLAALEAMVADFSPDDTGPTLDAARAAIAKAKGDAV